ncbi:MULTISPECIES: GNAT family N-acetyltransferase [unclassified Endozoicomonas]|uniref:GNAT family N-acetyltransferase n=1 Tax=unclassified Endozoicomonas TaxID=2644528 RepID=UPI002148FBA1|nr:MULTISPECIES: GNAT family N-acetyltransferase [unclassified Endozoicomonas]
MNFVIWRYFLNAGHYSDEALTLWTEGSNSENFMDSVEQNFLVAMMEGEEAGTGMIDTRDSAVDAIFVDPQFMRMGVARKMMIHLEQIAKEAGLSQIKLNSTLNAAPFYRRRGFEGDKVSTYHSPGGIMLDFIPMTKSLSE